MSEQREFSDEADRLFYEEMRAMPDDQLLAMMRQIREGLLADDGKLARELGLSEEYIHKISADIANLESAMEAEQQANEAWKLATDKLNAAAEKLKAAERKTKPE
ncbi:MAG TPA: hypothetical protein VEV84_10410 [Pyrinomonadaceae bacterium]|nr:hypothetical protein [Pyrinomonadaceae bacterium]